MDEDVRVTFAADFDYSPSAYRGGVTIAYLAGQERSVTRECAEAAVKAGALKPTETGPEPAPVKPRAKRRP